MAGDSFVICDSCSFRTYITCRTQFRPDSTHEENMEAMRRAEHDAERTEEREQEEALWQKFKSRRRASLKACLYEE